MISHEKIKNMVYEWFHSSNTINEECAHDILDEIGLTFDDLAEANVKRTVDTWRTNPKTDHTLLEWCAMLAGETGEVCEAAKKLGRREAGNELDKDAGKDWLGLLGEELGDVVIYCSLIAYAAGIDLGEAVAKKFNKTSSQLDEAFPERAPAVKLKVRSE